MMKRLMGKLWVRLHFQYNCYLPNGQCMILVKVRRDVKESAELQVMRYVKVA